MLGGGAPSACLISIGEVLRAKSAKPLQTAGDGAGCAVVLLPTYGEHFGGRVFPVAERVRLRGIAHSAVAALRAVLAESGSGLRPPAAESSTKGEKIQIRSR